MAKKKFIEVQIPLTRAEVKILAESLEEVKGRTIKLDLTRMLRGKSIEGTFRITIKENKAIGEPVRLLIMPYFIRRMMRKSTSYVEDSFDVECQDYTLKLKPFMITRKKVHRSVRKALREGAKQYLTEYLRNKKSDEIFSEVISSKIQKPLSLKLKKIYPLALCEIRDIKKLSKKPEAEVKTEKVE
ncbi:MAG: hypothetical protein ABIE22_03755 [archaeon]